MRQAAFCRFDAVFFAARQEEGGVFGIKGWVFPSALVLQEECKGIGTDTCQRVRRKWQESLTQYGRSDEHLNNYPGDVSFRNTRYMCNQRQN